MADFLFAEATPASCAAALRLLRADRLHFRQAGRAPPMFGPRSAAQVRSLEGALAAEAAEAAAWGRFVGDMEAAAAAAREAKPSEADWRAGPHADRLAALAAFALGSLPIYCAERDLATKTLVRLGRTPGPADAADLLQAAGWFPPHMQLHLLAAGVSEAFSPELEAEAQQLLAAPPPDPDAAARRDFSSHCVITVDDASTTEIDDGLSVERLPEGGLKVRHLCVCVWAGGRS